MAVIDDYWEQVAAGIGALFGSIRAAHSDSSVKGGANEEIVAEFLAANTGARRIATNSTIIDHYGNRSDEVDVAVLNDGQPFWTGQRGQLIIAEGVDAAYQVKAVLTSDELRRAVRNATSVKRLLRVMPNGSMASAINDEDGTRFIDHVPFFIFAFTSQITAATSLTVLEEAVDNDVAMQPDGIFVLNRWSLINIGSNTGSLQIGPPEARGFQELVGPQRALAHMLWCHHLLLHRRVDFVSPIVQYWPYKRLSKGAVRR